uniref:Uncharacterized protein n=1 Tax=Aquila chrysaetos chrysaetos TaxID=223781 RepID=A0A663FG82_AQUCH
LRGKSDKPCVLHTPALPRLKGTRVGNSLPEQGSGPALFLCSVPNFTYFYRQTLRRERKSACDRQGKIAQHLKMAYAYKCQYAKIWAREAHKVCSLV